MQCKCSAATAKYNKLPAAFSPSFAEHMVETLYTCLNSYECVKKAAEFTQKNKVYARDPDVQKLQFSHPWIRGFLNRYTMSRRRITSVSMIILRIKM